MAARPSPSRYRRPDLLSASRWHSWNSLRAAYPSPKDPPHCWSWSGLCCYLNQGIQEWSGPCLRPAAMVPRSNSKPIVERLRKIQSSSSYHVPWPASHTGSLNSHRCLGVAIGLFGRAMLCYICSFRVAPMVPGRDPSYVPILSSGPGTDPYKPNSPHPRSS